MTDVELDRLDGAATMDHFDEIQAVYHQGFPTYDLGDHRTRTTRQAGLPGFTTVTARVDGELVGFIYGFPLAGPGWWDGLDPAPAEGFTTETGGRTLAVIDLVVLPSQRGQGLGRRLMDELLAGRSEERATLCSGLHEVDNQKMYERWGWHRIGRIPGGPTTTEPWFELYVIALR